MEFVLKIILTLIGFVSLLFLAYVTARYIGGKQIKAMRGNYIKVLETVMIGADKRLHLVKAGNTYLLIATTSKSVEFLTTVDFSGTNGQETVEEAKEKEKAFDFRSLFEKYTGITRIKRDNGLNRQYSETPQDMTERRNLKSNLNRLRAIINRNQYQVGENGDEVTNDEEEQKKS